MMIISMKIDINYNISHVEKFENFENISVEYRLYVYGYKIRENDVLLNLNHEEDGFIRMKNDNYSKYKNLYQNYIRSEKIKKLIND